MMTAADIVTRLLEGDEEDVDPKRFVMAHPPDDIVSDEENERSRFQVSVHGCAEADGMTCRMVDLPLNAQPQFWTVYKRIFNYDEKGRLHPEALEWALRDFQSPEEANAYAEQIRGYYRAEGRLIEDDEDPWDDDF